MSDLIRKKTKSKKKIVALIFLFIAVFCSVFFAARGTLNPAPADKTVLAILSPFQRGFSWVGSQLTFLKDSVVEIKNLHSQNKLLREEVELLRAQNLTASEFASENQRLRALLGYKQVATQFDFRAELFILFMQLRHFLNGIFHKGKLTARP